MENNIQNKAKFFALYWGQTVQYEKGKARSYLRVNEHNIEDIYNDYLLLKPLSSISEDDLDVLGWSISEVKDIEKECYISGYETDYLRSQGYALSFLGVSVMQQLEYNWIKLKEN